MVIGEEEVKGMAKGKKEVEEDEKTRSFVLFGCRIQIRDHETKECIRGSSSGSDSSITNHIKDSQDGHNNFHRGAIATTSHPSTSTSTTIPTSHPSTSTITTIPTSHPSTSTSTTIPTSHPSTSTSTTILLPLFHNYSEEKKKKRKFVKPESHLYGWEGVLRNVGAMELTSISTKDLTISDTEEHQNRLLLPKSHVKENLLPLLTEEEKERLTQGGIPAIMVDAMGRQWETCFNFWASKSYNLNGDWTKLVETIGLSSARHRVEVKTFRHGGEARRLGFVVLHQNKDMVLLDLFN